MTIKAGDTHCCAGEPLCRGRAPGGTSQGGTVAPLAAAEGAQPFPGKSAPAVPLDSQGRVNTKAPFSSVLPFRLYFVSGSSLSWKGWRPDKCASLSDVFLPSKAIIILRMPSGRGGTDCPCARRNLPAVPRPPLPSTGGWQLDTETPQSWQCPPQQPRFSPDSCFTCKV